MQMDIKKYYWQMYICIYMCVNEIYATYKAKEKKKQSFLCIEMKHNKNGVVRHSYAIMYTFNPFLFFTQATRSKEKCCFQHVHFIFNMKIYYLQLYNSFFFFLLNLFVFLFEYAEREIIKNWAEIVSYFMFSFFSF